MNHFPTGSRGLAPRSASLTAALAASLVLTACTGGSGETDPTDDTLGLVSAAAQIDLGRALFFDERLSQPMGVSCGMCHDPLRGWGDGRPQGKGVQDHSLAGDQDGDGESDHNDFQAIAGAFHKTVLTDRNTPTIYNSHLYPNLFWDGRASGLDHQAQFPVEAGIEMNSSWDDHVMPLLRSDDEYDDLFAGAYGSRPITKERAIAAMGAFQSTIQVWDTPYDGFLAGDATALSPEAEHGRQLFFGKANCSTCHPGPTLTNLEFANTGVPAAGPLALTGGIDLGRGGRTDLTGDTEVAIDEADDYCKFKVPQLRMVAVTGPYMHNGAFGTLEEVVDFYDAGGGTDQSGTGTKDPRVVPLGLTDTEKAALVTFLRDGLTGTEIK